MLPANVWTNWIRIERARARCWWWLRCNEIRQAFTSWCIECCGNGTHGWMNDVHGTHTANHQPERRINNIFHKWQNAIKVPFFAFIQTTHSCDVVIAEMHVQRDDQIKKNPFFSCAVLVFVVKIQIMGIYARSFDAVWTSAKRASLLTNPFFAVDAATELFDIDACIAMVCCQQMWFLLKIFNLLWLTSDARFLQRKRLLVSCATNANKQNVIAAQTRRCVLMICFFPLFSFVLPWLCH